MIEAFGLYRFDPSREFYTDERCYINELSNSPDDEGCSIALARVEPGVTTQLHRVLDTVERYIILSGQGEVEIGKATPQKVQPFDVVLIGAGVPQKIRNTGTEDLRFLCICTPRFQQKSYRNDEA